MMHCECGATRLLGPCNSQQPADCQVQWQGQLLLVSSECLYALLDTDQVERSDEHKQLEMEV